ncbi:DAK2 domain-containing protein [Sciscionella marina]|uniref:DAK2 domain-containing protein n=1 Tax=Sciscionella marina TaxID=508770 RepID=UPI00058C674D|nr:DAK2 domain-containing protein [Sciscionella marina]
MACAGLGAGDVRAWISAGVRTLERHRAAIDAINVYPVADADTGTNLAHTLRAGFDALLRAEAPDAAAALRAVASGALAGARGNSGVLLSQVLRGFADVAEPGRLFGTGQLRSALHKARILAFDAVSEPADGTMLTVLAEIAERAHGTEPAELTASVVAVGSETLERTRVQLGALTAAGVVDAGAHGLLVLLTELHNTVAGAGTIALPPPGPGRAGVLARQADALLTVRESGASEFQYEVMYLLDTEAPTEALATTLGSIGDCVSIAGDGAGTSTVHVHCNDVGAAIEAGIETGRPYRITVARFADQVAVPSRFAQERALVTIARGPGVAQLFRAEGAAVLVLEPGAEPGVSEVLAVLTGSRAATVTVLSNEPELAELIEAGAQAARHAGQSVTVIPTMSPVQGLAALAVHDPARRAEDDVVAMAEAAAATRRGALVFAEQEALTWAGHCVPGDVLGMVDGEVVFIRHPVVQDIEGLVTEAAGELLTRMLGNGGELVTALLGMQAGETLGPGLRARVRAQHPEVDLTVYTGDQFDAVLVLGVE